jgi:hypothetical protein
LTPNCGRKQSHPTQLVRASPGWRNIHYQGSKHWSRSSCGNSRQLTNLAPVAAVLGYPHDFDRRVRPNIAAAKMSHEVRKCSSLTASRAYDARRHLADLGSYQSRGDSYQFSMHETYRTGTAHATVPSPAHHAAAPGTQPNGGPPRNFHLPRQPIAIRTVALANVSEKECQQATRRTSREGPTFTWCRKSHFLLIL